MLVEYIYHTVIARAVSHRRLAWLGRRALQQPVWTGFETRRRHRSFAFFCQRAHSAEHATEGARERRERRERGIDAPR